MISNNNYILNEIKNSMYMSGEALEADKIVTWSDIGSYMTKMLNQIEKRLKVGAKKYGEQVPIFKADNLDRNNLSEAIEEIQDSLVYCTALKIQTSELRHYAKNNSVKENYVNEYTLNITSAINYLQYSYFLLKKAESIKDHININNTISEEETT